MTKLRCMLCCLMICTITIDARTVNDIYIKEYLHKSP